jgi:hypothetical protein
MPWLKFLRRNVYETVANVAESLAFRIYQSGWKASEHEAIQNIRDRMAVINIENGISFTALD